MNRLKIILQHRYVFKILSLIVLIIVIIYTSFYQKQSIYNRNKAEFVGTIYKKKIKEDSITIYIKGKEKLVINCYQCSIDNVSLGDTIKIQGELKEPNNNTIPNIFNYKKYLYYNDIFYTVSTNNIEKISNNTNIIYYLKDKISNHIDNIPKSSEYIKIFVLGDTSLIDEDVINSYRINGVSHLFSISGMHISLFAGLILYILKRISYNNYYNYGIVISFLILYSLLVGSSVSVIRSLIMYILFSINKLFNLKIKSIDIMCIVLIILLLINPFYLYNISFQYSYSISFSLVLFSYKMKKIKKYQEQTIKLIIYFFHLISYFISNMYI